ncbi:hypothetical protein EJB05_17050 [Eragrostis curvula]|uniref:Ubiquitin-like protease family profile domain-containing protein n=1 Tax=Eragrostis curvula TaxID=38414 RepID=A0A5J9VGG7_9POAL|nr:hypothetical protein EJB05_17050 [Eragrostis curvula]
MAAERGGILIGLPAEVEDVGSSSSPLTHRPTAARDGFAGDDGSEAEFAIFSDQQLLERIKRWSAPGLLASTPDGGEKMRIRVNRMEKELERRRAVRQRKNDTVRGKQAKLSGGINDGSGDYDPFDFTSTDELSDDVSKQQPSSPRSTFIKGVAVSKVRTPCSQGKHAYSNNGGRMGKTSSSHQLKTSALHSKSTGSRSLNMNSDSTGSRRTRPLRSCNKRQTNNIVYSKGSWNKLVEDTTFGSDRRWDCSENKGSPYFKLKRDVVHLDVDDDTEPATYANIEITDPGAVEVTYSDMKCLEPEEFLKSPIINFYIQYLKNSRPRGDMYMFNTYFYCKLKEALSTMGDSDSQFSKLRRWWGSVDIFKKAYLILPINDMVHWSLIIVCMPTNEIESGPIMLHLDSLGLHDSKELFDTIASFLEAEWRHLQKDSYDVPFSRKIWEHLPRNIDKKGVPVPRQQNEYDCGLFMLYYIDRFIQEAPGRLTRRDLRMFGSKWFHPQVASALREGIRALLFDVFQNVQEDDEPSLSESQSGDYSEGGDKDADSHTDTIVLDDE